MKTKGKILLLASFVFASFSITGQNFVAAQQVIDLTFESSVEIAMENSYRIRQIEMGIESTRYRLQARQAGLKSRVYMNLQAPDINSASEFEWNSTLQRDEISRKDTSRWQMDLSIRQPVILLGYPTNGYLSLNNRIYRYNQKTEGEKNINYYNRYFVEFEQPLFQPNSLKNDIEQAELDLEREELEYIDDIVGLIDDIADDYYELFELSYQNVILSNNLKNLQKVSEIVKNFVQMDESREIEEIEVRVELANTQENLLQNQSDTRIETARIKQNLRLAPQDSITVRPEINIKQISVDLEQAIEYGYTLRPRMQSLEINKRRNEINLEETKGRDSFEVNLGMTYGLEKQDEEYTELWNQHDNSYSVSVNAYVPIWDWGERKASIEASKISIKQNDLSIEEARSEIRSDITNAVENLEEYQKRALNMKENRDVVMKLTDLSITQFSENKISVQDILRNIERQRETEQSFLDAYLGYKNSILRLMVNTYYDYEKNISLLDQFRSQQESRSNSTDYLSQNLQTFGN